MWLRNTDRLVTLIFGLSLVVSLPIRAQYFRRAKVEHVSPSTARISVNDPRPMRQVVQGLRRNYGLLIDYEEPPYFSSYDVVDATNSTWRTKHPGARPYLGIAGGAFTSDFPEISPERTESSARVALAKITADYDHSANPGRFAVRSDGPHRLSVVGTSMRDQNGRQTPAPALLDTYVTASVVRQNNAEAILDALCDQLTTLTGKTVVPGTNPVNMMTQTRVVLNSGSATKLTSRAVLMKISAAARYSLVWTLNWDPNEQFYVLNLTIATKLTTRPDGTIQVTPLKLD